MRRPIAGEGEVAWRKYAEVLEDRAREHRLTSFRLTRIEEALGIPDGSVAAKKAREYIAKSDAARAGR